MLWQSQALQVEEDVRVRKSNLTTMDMTGARWFISKPELHAQLTDIVRRHVPNLLVMLKGQEFLFSAAVRVLMMAFSKVYNIWRSQVMYTDAMVHEYRGAIDQFGSAWCALGWKPTVWVHWTVRHSGFFARTLRNFYLYSSIPS